MKNIIDDVNISQRIYDTWMNYAIIAIHDLLVKYPDLQPGEIPDEGFRELPGGAGEIYIKIRGSTIKMRVPPDEWEHKKGGLDPPG